MRLYQTYKFRNSRKHIIKRLKQNLSNPEKYIYYINKLTSLYKSYKKYSEEDILHRMNDYLKVRGLKTEKFYYQEKIEDVLKTYKDEINTKVNHIILAFKKLESHSNKKIEYFQKKVIGNRTQSKTKVSIS